MTFTDIDTGEVVMIGDADLLIAENTINISTDQLTANRLYTISVIARNVAGPGTSFFQISKDKYLQGRIDPLKGEGNQGMQLP